MNSSHHHPGDAIREIELSYALVADSDVRRTAACLESIKPFNVGALIARDGNEAAEILQRFGPPLLLIADLSLPGKDAPALIEMVRRAGRGRAGIIAWSSSRERREFAAHRLKGLNVRVLDGAIAPAVLRAVIERVLGRGTPSQVSSSPSTTPAAEEVHQTMTELAEKARQLCGTAGVAVYLKATEERRFRTSISWTADEPIPDISYYLPRVFSWILENREALVSPDLETQPLPDVSTTGPRDVRGLVAVPIVSGDQQIIGTICVFGVKPLVLGRVELDALEALGHGVSARPTTTPVHPSARPQPRRNGEPASTRRDDRGELLSVGAPPELLDRRTGSLAISRELARLHREPCHLSVVLFDVDAREATSGPPPEGPTSDPILAVSNTLTRTIRGSDLAIRWSRGELLVVLPGLNEAQARQVAERVRAGMQAGARHRLAVAGGVAELFADDTFESAVIKANEKVRLAREHGHNRIG